MIEYKFYKELKEFAEKLGLPSDKEIMRSYVKLVEKFNKDIKDENWKLIVKNKSGRIQHGQIAVNRKELKEHMKITKSVILHIDEIMKNPTSYSRGGMVADQITRLLNSVYCFERYYISNVSTESDVAKTEQKLIELFNKNQDDLILRASTDGTRRHNLMYWIESDDKEFGGTVNYNKKERRFDYIQYNANGYAKQIPI